MDELNQGHHRHLLSRCRQADKLLSDIEAILDATNSKSPFPKYRQDLVPAQAGVVRNYIARIRAQLVRVLAGVGITPDPPRFGALHSIRVNLAFVRVAIAEMEPRHLRGYGEVPESLGTELRGVAGELEGLVQQLDIYLEQGMGADLAGRLERLGHGTAAGMAQLLQLLDEVITTHGLVEFRPSLTMIVERLETERFEIAVFGRVNSGKSSLLNHVLAADILPVGVRPITSVPTHLVYGPEAKLRVRFAGSRREETDVARLAEFVSEEHNPGNTKGVSGIVVEVPSGRLAAGVAFVDTPGVGSLETAGTAETLAYLPRCDLGAVLINAAATVNEEDLAIIRALYEAAIPVQVLLSKADLLSTPDRQAALDYIAGRIRAELALDLTVHPVSIVASHAPLLDDWFQGEIAALYARRRELAAASARRKTNALRQAVETVLRRRLDQAASAPPEDQARLREMESELRRVRGRIGEVLDECVAIAGRLRDLAPAAVERAVTAAVTGYEKHGRQAMEGLIRSTIADAAAAEATQAYQVLRELAAEAAAALEAVRTALATAAPLADGWLAPPRELPRIDLGTVEFTVPALRLFLGGSINRKRITRQLQRDAGAALATAFTAYSRVVEAWVRDAVRTLERRFDAVAEPYRAQLAARLQQQTAASPEETAAIRGDLEKLAVVSAGEPAEAR